MYRMNDVQGMEENREREEELDLFLGWHETTLGFPSVLFIHVI
jgi:hypothetical protein